MRRGPGAALLLAALLIAGCGPGDADAPASVPIPVTVTSVASVDVEDRIEATGQLLAVEQAEIAAEVGGRITEIVVGEGRPVEADVAVLTIDPERRTLEVDRARARADEARAALREQERERARVKELRDRKVASQTQLDQAETALALARARLLAAEADLGVAERALRDATVRAPFAGLIAERFVSRGEYVTPGQKLFDLVSLDPIDVEFRLTEVESSRAALGQTVAVRVAPFPDEVFEGRVTVVSPIIDEKSRTLRVKARIGNADRRLRPGLFARIDLGVAKRSGVAMIPEEAVLQRADGPVVFRLAADDRAERVVIETGAHHDHRVEVTRGLRPGDVIVTRGQFRLTDGQRVALRTAAGDVVDGPGPDVAEVPQ
jgi:membrane fusion protein (multidrug efflux system)